MTRRRVFAIAAAIVCAMAVPRTACAQSSTGSLSTILPSFTSIDEDVLAGLNTSIIGQLSTYPVGTSSGGLIWEFDPSLGMVVRKSRSFGPAFAERALTIGTRRVSFAVNVQHAAFDRFEGHDLTNLRFFEDSNQAALLQLHLTADTTAFVAQAGVLPRLDVGIVVPVTRVKLDASTARREGTTVTVLEHKAGTASGVGDVVIKAKYNFRQGRGGGLAAAADFSLPSGDRSNLLGVGFARLKLSVIGSAEVGMFAPHVNAGITIPPRSLGPDVVFPLTRASLNILEVNYSGGVDVIASPRLTITADMIGRTKRFQDRFGDFTDPDTPTRTIFTLLNSGQGTLTQILGSAGAKMNIRGTLLLTASVLLPLNHAGLSSHIATVVGFDYGF
jgi:hypothetical protein